MSLLAPYREGPHRVPDGSAGKWRPSTQAHDLAVGYDVLFRRSDQNQIRRHTGFYASGRAKAENCMRSGSHALYYHIERQIFQHHSECELYRRRT